MTYTWWPVTMSQKFWAMSWYLPLPVSSHIRTQAMIFGVVTFACSPGRMSSPSASGSSTTAW